MTPAQQAMYLEIGKVDPKTGHHIVTAATLQEARVLLDSLSANR